MKKKNLRVENKGGVSPSLTEKEREVYHYLTHDFLTPGQIAVRRQTSKNAVYKIIQRLKQKEILNKAFSRVEKIESTIQPFRNGIRLHGQEFNIQILYKDHRYKEKIKKHSNLLYIDGNTIRLYKNSIEVYGEKSFLADSVDKATANSMSYWQRFLSRLENDLDIILMKPRAQNIRLVNAHYSEIHNELAKDCNIKSEKIRIYSKDDGKLWFLIDNSFNLHEAETVHPETSTHDMGEIVKPFFNDLRDNRPPTLSEIMNLVNTIVKVNQETAAGLNTVVGLLQQQTTTLKTKEICKFERQTYIG